MERIFTAEVMCRADDDTSCSKKCIGLASLSDGGAYCNFFDTRLLVSGYTGECLRCRRCLDAEAGHE